MGRRVRPRLIGMERDRIARGLLHEYQAGTSIRQLAAGHDRSIGAVRRLLIEQGVTFRPRGGAHRRRTA